jgi:pimeloyl-ACP methyl ester carboxylesterase
VTQQSGRVAASGVELAYRSEGDGPLVLLIHGFPDTPQTWDLVMPELAARGFRAVAPFLRGYHPSSIAGDGRYDVEMLGRDVRALIDALAGDAKRAIVVGHDFGALARLT